MSPPKGGAGGHLSGFDPGTAFRQASGPVGPACLGNVVAIEIKLSGPARALALALALTAAVVAPAAARGIVVESASNNSDQRVDVDEEGWDHTFRSQLRLFEPTSSGGRADLALHYAWSMGLLSDPPPATPLVLLPHRLGWSLTVSVQDPADQGFRLSVESTLRGVVAASVEDQGYAISMVPDLEVWMYEMFATTPRRLDGLTLDGNRAGAEAGSTQRVELRDQGSQVVGRYRGTQSFLFYVQPPAAYGGAVSFVPSAPAYAWQQFGVATDSLRMAFVNPGPGEPPVGDLGQSFRISVDYMAAAPVPEPASLALMAAGVALLLMRRRGLTRGEPR